jgi:hypothetical protein
LYFKFKEMKGSGGCVHVSDVKIYYKAPAINQCHTNKKTDIQNKGVKSKVLKYILIYVIK